MDEDTTLEEQMKQVAILPPVEVFEEQMRQACRERGLTEDEAEREMEDMGNFV